MLSLPASSASSRPLALPSNAHIAGASSDLTACAAHWETSQPTNPGLQLGTRRFWLTRSRRLPVSAACMRMRRQTCLSMNGQIRLLSIIKVIYHGLHGLA